jgi:hypothetical protein
LRFQAETYRKKHKENAGNFQIAKSQFHFHLVSFTMQNYMRNVWGTDGFYEKELLFYERTFRRFAQEFSLKMGERSRISRIFLEMTHLPNNQPLTYF